MKKLVLLVMLFIGFNPLAFARCTDFVGKWTGITTHQDPLHLLTCQYTTHAVIVLKAMNSAPQVMLTYTLDRGKVKKICKKSLPTSIYTIQCGESHSDAIALYRQTGKGLTTPPRFGGWVNGGQLHATGKLGSSKVKMVLKKERAPSP